MAAFNASHDSLSHDERQTAISVRLFQHREEALTSARTHRPKNTNKAYGPKQKEWTVSIVSYGEQTYFDVNGNVGFLCSNKICGWRIGHGIQIDLVSQRMCA